ncbi:GtrA family protein [Streptomyces sp. NPDC020801]|uniref:GtrA family protein n=1 Tax=unclassified Streptomyces TaxID=2593676 RepID=UPI0037A048DB
MTVNLAESRPAANAPAPVRVTANLPLPDRPLARLVLEAVKFAVVGGSGVVVNFLVFGLLLEGLGRSAMTATVLASCVAMATNYLGFRHFAYRDRASCTARHIALFFAFSGVGVVMESALFYIGYHGLGMRGPVGVNAVKALSIVLASAFRFLVCRTWVFRHDARRAA